MAAMLPNQAHLRYTTSAAIRGLIGLKYVDPTSDSIVATTGARLP